MALMCDGMPTLLIEGAEIQKRENIFLIWIASNFLMCTSSLIDILGEGVYEKYFFADN